MQNQWTLFGPKLEAPKPSWVFLVLAFLFAAETFIEFGNSYPLYMTLLAIGASGWAVFLAVQKRALIGLAFLPVAGLWFNNFTTGEWFNSLNAISFTAHALLALLFGVAGYTFAAWEKK